MTDQLAEKTLGTKGTLTGVIDRLEQKGWVRQEVPLENRHCFTIGLTSAGEQMVEAVFPIHSEHLKKRLGQLTDDKLKQIQASLQRLRFF
jgi:MarR family 2-MHQ and catechol resistance regulon transcriptional repressor